MAECMELYRDVTPPGYNIPTSVQPVQIDDSVTTDEKVKYVVGRLRGHWSGGLSWMRAKHLREWIKEHRAEEAAVEAEAEEDTSETKERERGTEERS